MLRLLNRLWIIAPWTADVFSSVVRWAYPKWIWIRSLMPALKRYQIRSLSVATTNVCNAACVFCAYRKATHPKGVMTHDNARNVVAVALKLGLEHIDLTPTVGDPLVDKNLEDKIAVITSYGFKTSITTNCILMTPKRADDLMRAGLDEVFISIPSFERGDYEEIYGVDKWDQATAGLLAILEWRMPDTKIRIRFRNRLKPSKILNHPTWDRIKPHLGRNVTFNFTHSFDNWGGSITELPEGMQLRRNGSKSNHPCLGLSHMSVLWDGTIRACGCRFKDSERDDMVVGTVNDFRKACGNMRYLRNDFMRGKKPEACIGCSFYNPE